MILVLLIAGLLWGLGHLMGVSRGAKTGVLAVLFGMVAVIQLTLPAGHNLRVMTGGDLRSWLFLAAVVAVILIYRHVLKKLRTRAPETQSTAASGPFSSTELERYARHIVLREIGGAGQQKLKKARVLAIGAGGLGSPLLLYLAAAGVGNIGVIDDDEVSLSNLQRQVLFDETSIGTPKVFSAQKGLKALNPHIEIRPYNRRLTADNARELFAGFDLVLDGSDNFATRYLVNETCVALKIPLIAAAISQWEGQISLYDPAGGAPCYACIFPQAPAEGLAPSCAEAGVVGALPGVIGAMMAVEAIKEITGAGQSLRGAMLIYDALYAENRRMKLTRRKDCSICGKA